jgi:hypothetical protein
MAAPAQYPVAHILTGPRRERDAIGAIAHPSPSRSAPALSHPPADTRRTIPELIGSEIEHTDLSFQNNTGLLEKSLHSRIRGAHISPITSCKSTDESWLQREGSCRLQENSEVQNGLRDRLTTARAWLRANKLLGATFEAALIGDPALSILLDLYIGQFEGRETTLSNLCTAVDIPSSTMLRYVRHLRDMDLIEKHDHIIDDWTADIRLTLPGIEKVNSALDGVTTSNEQLGIGHLRLIK